MTVNSSKSLVSVVMPTHNSRPWVSDTIDNLLSQTYPHIELVVVDDGSTDGAVEIVRQKLTAEFRGDWKVIELTENRGPSAARNIGLRAATGGWIQFLDSDDFMAPDKFERQMSLCATAPDDVVGVYSPWRRCYFDEGRVSWAGPLVQPDMEGRAPIMCLVSDERPLHAAGLARRATLDAIGGFDESLRFWECEEVTVRLAKAGRLLHAPSDEPLYLWREHRDREYIGGENARYDFAKVAQSWIELMVKAAEGRSFEQLGITARDRQDILVQCTNYARQLYCEDVRAFRAFLAQAKIFDPDIAPAYPGFATFLSPYLSYEAVEGLARLSRAPAALMRKFRPTALAAR